MECSIKLSKCNKEIKKDRMHLFVDAKQVAVCAHTDRTVWVILSSRVKEDEEEKDEEQKEE
jgi:hypothetical protein